MSEVKIVQVVLVPEQRWEELQKWLREQKWLIIEESEKTITAISPTGIVARFFKA